MEFYQQKYKRQQAMKPKFKLNMQDLQGFQTIKQVIEHICKNKQLQLDSFFLMDENEQLLTAANTAANLANVNQIYVYDLKDNYSDMKKLEKELHGETRQNRHINVDEEIANQQMKEKLNNFNLDNEITKILYEKKIIQFNTSNEIVHIQHRQVNLSRQFAKKQFQLQLQQFNDNNEIAKMLLKKQLKSQHADSQAEFETLLKQFNDDNDIAKKELERQLQSLDVQSSIENRNLQKWFLQKQQESNVQENLQVNVRKESNQMEEYEDMGNTQIQNQAQQKLQTYIADFSTKIENQRKDYEQKIQNIQTEATAKSEEANKQFQAQQQTMQQRFNEQIAQANKNSEAQLKKQIDESNDKFQKANNDFNEEINSLQQNHKDDTQKLNNELQNQKQKFEEEKSRLSKIINDTQKELNEEKYQFQIQQLKSKSEFEKKLKDLQTEKDSAIDSLKNEFYKKKEQLGTEMYQRKQIELQINQLTELKQQNEQIIAQYTQDLKASNFEKITLKYNIEELNRNLAQQVDYLNQQKTQYETSIQNLKQSFEQFQTVSYYQVQQLQYQLGQAQLQEQQLYNQIVQLSEEKTILETQSQNNDKKYKQTISELEQQHEAEIEQSQKKLKSSKTAFDELESMNQKLIKEKNLIQIDLQEKLDELQKANKKYKTLESDYEISKGKVTGDAELQLEQLRVVLREEKNKNEGLIVELQKIPQLQKKIVQTEQEFLKKKTQNDEDKQQLENQIAQIKKDLQTMTVNKNDLQNELYLSKSQQQHLKDRLEKINTEKSEKDKMIQKEQEQVLLLENEINKLKLNLNLKVIEVTTFNQQIQSLTENLAKRGDFFEKVKDEFNKK